MVRSLNNSYLWEAFKQISSFRKKKSISNRCMALFVLSIVTNTWCTGQIDQFGREKERRNNLDWRKIAQGVEAQPWVQQMGFRLSQCEHCLEVHGQVAD
jgi:hypothetical protein